MDGRPGAAAATAGRDGAERGPSGAHRGDDVGRSRVEGKRAQVLDDHQVARRQSGLDLGPGRGLGRLDGQAGQHGVHRPGTGDRAHVPPQAVQRSGPLGRLDTDPVPPPRRKEIMQAVGTGALYVRACGRGAAPRWVALPPMAKRALITGVTGQDGSYLAEFLLSQGYTVIGMVRRSSTVNFERIAHIQDRLELVAGDLPTRCR